MEYHSNTADKPLSHGSQAAELTNKAAPCAVAGGYHSRPTLDELKASFKKQKYTKSENIRGALAPTMRVKRFSAEEKEVFAIYNAALQIAFKKDKKCKK